MPCKSLFITMFGLVAACQAQLQPTGTTTEPATSAPAANQLAPPAPPPAQADITPEINALLDHVQNSADDLTSFTGKIIYEKEDAVLGRKEIRTGEIIYRLEPKADKKKRQSFAVVFDSLIVNNVKRKYEKHYIFSDRWLAEVDHENKQFIKRELVRPGDELDPLKLGEGPFPLPIGQQKAEVLARFDVTPLEVPKDGRLKDLQNVHGLLLTPKAGTPEAKEFTQVELFYDQATNLPIGINAIEKNGDRKTVRLSDVQRNVMLDEAQLKKLSVETPDPGAGWDVDVRAWKTTD